MIGVRGLGGSSKVARSWRLRRNCPPYPAWPTAYAGFFRRMSHFSQGGQKCLISVLFSTVRLL